MSGHPSNNLLGMDPVSQGVVGAVLAQAFAREDEVRVATLAGVAGGMAADLDVLIKSAEDPLLTIEYHRHFTHSLAFIPLGGLLVATVLWPLVRRRAGFRRWWWFATLGYATAGLLDACTSYGTRLLWPISDARVAWDLISIIDPLFTLPLLVLMVWTLVRRRPRLARVACAFALLYMGSALMQQRRAEAEAWELARSRGHEVERLVVKPSIGNLLVWRSTYAADGRIWVDAIRAGLQVKTYAGDSVPSVSVADFQQLPPDSVLREDIDRFAHFSDDWLCWHPNEAGVLGDARYGSLPDEVRPLWGIRVDPEQSHVHTPFVRTRRVDGPMMERFWAMLRGAELPQRDR